MLLKLRQRLYVIVAMLAFTALILLPMLYYKYLHFGDPLSPLLARYADSPQPALIRFYNSLQHFKDAKILFPLNLIIPSSIGYISTILGVGTFIIITFLLYFRTYKAEVIAIGTFIAATVCFGQVTARFFIEPYFWALPLFLLSLKRYKWNRYLVIAGQVQLLLLLPFYCFAVYALSPGIVSDKQRDVVMRRNSAGYAECKWIDSLLPADAVIATDIRSRSLLPRNYFPIEYIPAVKDDTIALDAMLREKYKVNYLVFNDSGSAVFKERYAGAVIASKTFYKATRNPFNNISFRLTVYRLKPAQ